MQDDGIKKGQVISLAPQQGDNSRWDIKTALNVLAGEDLSQYNKAVLIFLDDKDMNYSLRLNMVNIKHSEAISLLDVAKATFIKRFI